MHPCVEIVPMLSQTGPFHRRPMRSPALRSRTIETAHHHNAVCAGLSVTSRELAHMPSEYCFFVIIMPSGVRLCIYTYMFPSADIYIYIYIFIYVY